MAGSHSHKRKAFTRDARRRNEGARLDRGQDLVQSRLAFPLRGKAALDGAAAFLGLYKLAAALGTGLLGLALDPERLRAALAALRRCQTDIDDVLEASCAPAADVTAHADLPDARLLCNSSFALGGKTSKAQVGTESTGSVPTLHLFGAPLSVGNRSAASAWCGHFGAPTGLASVCAFRIRRAGSNGP